MKKKIRKKYDIKVREIDIDSLMSCVSPEHSGGLDLNTGLGIDH